MEKRKYQGPQPQITAAPISAIHPGLGKPGGVNVGKYEKLIRKRGNIVPVTATHAQNGALALAGGHDVFSAYQNCGAEDIPVIIAQTTGESDALLLTLDMMLIRSADHLTVSSCLCRLIDEYKVPRRELADTLGRSLPWLSLAERIGRRLTPAVKEMLSRDVICMRSAQEIALLPADVQQPFAEQVANLALNKGQVSQWVSLYTENSCSKNTRDAMLNDPITCLKRAQIKKAPAGYSLFRRVMQRCKAALHELVRIAGTLPDSSMDEACAQLRELMEEVAELPDIFTRVNMEGCE